MKRSNTFMEGSLPLDIALKIVSSLQVFDVCALGSCSRFWREFCGLDCIWEPLARGRWPSLPFHCDDVSSSSSSSTEPIVKGWRDIYVRMYIQMASRATSLVEYVEQCSSSGSLEVGDYDKAIKNLVSMQLSFGDVRTFLFKPEHDVLLNLIGLHYCIFCLDVPASQVMDAMLSCKISEQQVCVRWWKLGRWFYGFRMRDESHSRRLSLSDLLTEKGEQVLGVLRRGAIHEVFRIEISNSDAENTRAVAASVLYYLYT